MEREVISEDEMVLTIYPEGVKECFAKARMHRIGNEWKFGGFR